MTHSVIDRVANQFGAIALRLADAQRAALAPVVGVSGEAAAALTALEAYPGERVSFFVPVLGLTSAGTVRLIGRLEQLGLAERRAGADARSHALRLTAAGRAAAQRIRDTRQDVLQRALAPLDDAAIAQLGKLLEPVLAALPADRDAARHLCRLCDHAVCDNANACPADHAVTAAGHPHWHGPAGGGRPRPA
jgi:MarR family transcriptional repressor of emrRAB